jgi:hypothetical protein
MTTTAARRAPRRRRLKHTRLAAAGRQHDDAVAPLEDRVHRLALQRTESEKPHTRWSASASSAISVGVGVLDVVIDQTLEIRRQLVVGAAQRRHVLAVDEDRAARLLAGARQADADVRRLRLAGPLTTQPITASVIVSTPSYASSTRHLLADVVLDPLGQLLERAARRAAAAGTRGHARRERPQPERLQQLAGGVDLLAAVPPGRGVSDTRIVSPMPSLSRHAHRRRDQTEPFDAHAASVSQRCSGWSVGAPARGRRDRDRAAATSCTR